MWFYDRQGERAGPVEAGEMQRLAQAGQLTAQTLVWRDGFAGWAAAGQTELASLFAGQAPGLPPSLVPAAPAMGATPVSMAPVAAYSPVPIGPAQPWQSQVQAPYGLPGAYGPVPGVHFAGFWIRAVAYVIDIIIVELMAVLLGGLVGGLLGLSAGRSINDDVVTGLIGSVGSLIGLVVGIGYFVFFVAGGWQATPGKKMLGLRVVSETGRRVGFGQSLGRYFGMIVSSVILGFGFWMIGWTAQKRALHDMMAGTRVIYARR